MKKKIFALLLAEIILLFVVSACETNTYNVFTAGTSYNIYLGLCDKDTGKVELTFDAAKKKRTLVLIEKKIAYTVIETEGVFYDDGMNAVNNETMIYMGINVSESTLDELVDKFKEQLNLESVYVEKIDKEYALFGGNPGASE